MSKNFGIYLIKNLITGKVYIGSSSNIKSRFWIHKNRLNHQLHHSQHLQHSWNKYGEENFTFEKLEYCTKEDRYVREQWWMDLFESYNSDYGYNIVKVSKTGGACHLELTKKKISIGRKKWCRTNPDKSTSRSIKVINLNTMQWKNFDSITLALEYYKLNNKISTGLSLHIDRRPYKDFAFISTKTKGGYDRLKKVYLKWVKMNSGYYTGVLKQPIYGYNTETKEIKAFCSKQEYIDYTGIEKEDRDWSTLINCQISKGWIFSRSLERLKTKVKDYEKQKADIEERKNQNRFPVYRIFVEHENYCTRYVTTTELINDYPQCKLSGVNKCLYGTRKTHKGVSINKIPI